VRDGVLYGALRDPNEFRKHCMADGNRLPPGAVGVAIELQIDEKGCARPAMSHQISHQHLNEVSINLHVYSTRYYSREIPVFETSRLILRSRTAILYGMIKRIKFLGIPVADQDRALEFYTEKLGFRVLTDQAFSEKQRWIELSIPGAETGITLFTPEGHENRIGTFINSSWEVDDIDKTYHELQAKGVELGGPPQKQSWGSFLTIKDSEGNQILLSSR
jgi:predicted enzyme related to lactoylglutathione lyase